MTTQNSIDDADCNAPDDEGAEENNDSVPDTRLVQAPIGGWMWEPLEEA
jgi:hypothetical protein